MHQLYVGVKGEVCCQLPDQVEGGRGQWILPHIYSQIYFRIYDASALRSNRIRSAERRSPHP